VESSGVDGTRDDGVGQVQVLLPCLFCHASLFLNLRLLLSIFIVFFVYFTVVKCVLLMHI